MFPQTPLAPPPLIEVLVDWHTLLHRESLQKPSTQKLVVHWLPDEHNDPWDRFGRHAPALQ